MSVEIDFYNISSQLASMARMIIEQEMNPDKIGIRPPLGGRLVLNMDVAEKIGIEVPAEIMPFIHEIISSHPNN